RSAGGRGIQISLRVSTSQRTISPTWCHRAGTGYAWLVIHPMSSLRPRRIRPSLHGLASIAIASAVLVTSCGSDGSDDAPATSVSIDTLVTAPAGEGGAGVPLEPGSNLPPSESETTPSDTTVGSDLLA